MKKKVFWLAAMAVTVSMASCSLEEVVEQPAPQAIGFSSFVGKPTKAATEIVGVGGTSGLTKFYVFGKYGSTQGGTYTNTVFDNVEVSATSNQAGESTNQYWIAGQYYKFVAYSDGNNKIDGTGTASVSLDSDNSGSITISNYKAGTNDLILATPDEVTAGNQIANNSAIGLSFSHLLSQVSFEFVNGFATNGYDVEISNLQFAVKNTGTYTSNNSQWNVTADAGENIVPAGEQSVAIASTAPDAKVASKSWFVIPQPNGATTSYQVTFTATVKDGDVEVATKEFQASLATGGTSTPTSTTDVWTAGYRYKYTATIDAKAMNMESNVIKFYVSAVTDWDDAEFSDDLTLEDKQ